MIELGDIVAEHENRISFLENSLPGSAMSYQEKPPEAKPEKPWTKRQWAVVQQLRGEMANLKRKLIAIEGTKKQAQDRL